MKIFLLFVSLFLFMSACSTEKNRLSEKEYQRSNAASQKALNKLDRE
ncbi:hypothetical protein [Sulfurimonas sp. NWX79]